MKKFLLASLLGAGLFLAFHIRAQEASSKTRTDDLFSGVRCR